MVAPLIPAAIAAAGGLLGSELANRRSSGLRKDAQNMLDQYKDRVAGLNLPELTPAELEQYGFDYVPEDQAATELGTIQVDPRFQENQLAALQELAQIGQSGGLRFEDQVMLNKLQNQLAAEDAGRQQAITQGMQERGLGGSGIELAQRLQAQQSAADRAASSSQDIAAMAQNRALESILQAGNLAGGLRSQEYGEKSNAARAQDMINQFNTQNRNQAGMMRQNVGQANTDIRNQQRMQPNQIAQQNFENQLGKEGLYGNAVAGSAATRTSAAEEKAKRDAGIFGGLANIATSAFNK